MSNCTDKLMILVFLSLFSVIVGGGIYFTWPKYRQACDLEVEENRILAEIEEKKAKIREIKAKQQRLNSDREFVETLARKNCRVFPGELVFVFDD